MRLVRLDAQTPAEIFTRRIAGTNFCTQLAHLRVPPCIFPVGRGTGRTGNIVLHFPQARLLTVFGLEDSVVYFCAALRLL